jgi:multiple sugar transport system ATP-binding protein
MVFQNYALYPHMTVMENMSFGLRIRGYSDEEIDQRVRHAAEYWISRCCIGSPAKFPGGQRQRVAVGRAIVRKPKVFLFDEPFSNLDAKMRGETRGELIRLHERLQTTMVYVTHDQVEAMTLGDRIAVLKDGAVQQIGKPIDLYRRPKNRFVAEFIGSPPMNIFQCHGVGSGGQCVVGPGALSIETSGSVSTGGVFKGWGGVLLGVRPEDIHDRLVSNRRLCRKGTR